MMRDIAEFVEQAYPEWFIIPLVFALLVWEWIDRKRVASLTDPVARAYAQMKKRVVIMLLFAGILWFSLSSTRTLDSFGYPDTVKEVASEEQLLRLLQDYNRALVRTSDVLFWFMLCFFAIVTNFLEFAKSIGEVDHSPH